MKQPVSYFIPNGLQRDSTQFKIVMILETFMAILHCIIYVMNFSIVITFSDFMDWLQVHIKRL